MTLAGLILVLLIVSIIPIYLKIKEHSRKIEELEKATKIPEEVIERSVEKK